MMQAVFREAEYAPGWALLSDRRAVREPQTKDFIERVVAFLRRHGRELEHGRWAMVVSGVAVYGMARMAQELAGECQCSLACSPTWTKRANGSTLRDLKPHLVTNPAEP